MFVCWLFFSHHVKFDEPSFPFHKKQVSSSIEVNLFKAWPLSKSLQIDASHSLITPNLFVLHSSELVLALATSSPGELLILPSTPSSILPASVPVFPGPCGVTSPPTRVHSMVTNTQDGTQWPKVFYPSWHLVSTCFVANLVAHFKAKTYR